MSIYKVTFCFTLRSLYFYDHDINTAMCNILNKITLSIEEHRFKIHILFITYMQLNKIENLIAYLTLPVLRNSCCTGESFLKPSNQIVQFICTTESVVYCCTAQRHKLLFFCTVQKQFLKI